jgi:TnpA family transposase
MPRRELLTPTERLQLLAFPEDAGELIRVLTLSKADIAFVRQHRGDHNRFGIAVLMAYLRYPGRTLAKDEKPHVPVLNLIAEQLQIPVAAWELYADRDETRREHLVELLSLLDMKQFSTRHYRASSEWLEPTALQTTRGMVLAQAVVEELRKRLIVLPPVAVIERLCAEAATRA